MRKKDMKDIDLDDEECEFYMEARCQHCDIELSNEEDINNLGLCNECYKTTKL